MYRKVLFIVNHEDTLLQFRMELLERLININDEVYVALPEGNKADIFRALGINLKFYKLEQHGINPFSDFSALLHLLTIIKEVNPDIVLTYTIKPNAYGGIACRILRKKYIATITGLGHAFEKGGMLELISAYLLKIGLKNAITVFYQNQANRKKLVKYNIAHERATMVNGSGVNLKIHNYENYPNNSIIKILFVGRISIEKGIRELITVAKKIKSVHNNICFYTLGNVEEECINLISEAEKNGLITQFGLHDNVQDYIKLCDAVILPSYHEGMSNALLEAAAIGRPLLASDIPGCRETMINGITGYLFKPKDVASMQETIINFASLDQKQRELMGRKGRAYVEENFDREHIVDAYMKVIHDN